MQLTWLTGAPGRSASVHRRVVGPSGLGSSATQLMRAVSWHDMADVSSPVSDLRIPRWRAESGRQSAGFVVEVGSAKCGWLAESRSARIPTSRSRHRVGVVSERDRSMAGRALAELKVAGPYAGQHQVVVGARAGGALKVHAAGWLVLAGSRRAETRRTKSRSHSPRPSWSVFTAESVGGGGRVYGSGCLGPLQAAVAPLVAGRLVEMGAAAGSRAWPPALREWWHTCRQCCLPVGAKRQLTNACS